MSTLAQRSLTLVSTRGIGVREASGVAALGAGRFLVVDDEQGAFVVGLEDKPRRLASGGKLRDLEGIALGPTGEDVYVLSERGGRLFHFALQDRAAPELGEPTTIGALPAIGKRKNRGWEGIAIAHHLPWLAQGTALVGAHQDKPCCVALFSLPELDELASWQPPKPLRQQLMRFNGVTIDPATGHLFALSGRAALVLELGVSAAATGLEIEPVALHELPASKGVPEGITMDDNGTLWIVTDGAGRLLELRVQRRAAP